MGDLTFVRTLVWDTDKKVFSDEFLNQLLLDHGNKYIAAGMALTTIQGNPDKIKTLQKGSVTRSYDDITKAIERYFRMGEGAGGGIVEVEGQRVY